MLCWCLLFWIGDSQLHSYQFRNDLNHCSKLKWDLFWSLKISQAIVSSDNWLSASILVLLQGQKEKMRSFINNVLAGSSEDLLQSLALSRISVMILGKFCHLPARLERCYFISCFLRCCIHLDWKLFLRRVVFIELDRTCHSVVSLTSQNSQMTW